MLQKIGPLPNTSMDIFTFNPENALLTIVQDGRSIEDYVEEFLALAEGVKPSSGVVSIIIYTNLCRRQIPPVLLGAIWSMHSGSVAHRTQWTKFTTALRKSSSTISRHLGRNLCLRHPRRCLCPYRRLRRRVCRRPRQGLRHCPWLSQTRRFLTWSLWTRRNPLKFWLLSSPRSLLLNCALLCQRHASAFLCQLHVSISQCPLL